MEKRSERKDAFTSVESVLDGKEEYLTEEQTAEIKKVFRQCARISIASVVFSVISFVCLFLDKINLFIALQAGKVMAIIGYVGLGCLILTLILLLITRGKLKELYRKYSDGDETV